ncbi:MAG: SpoIID/LytB domain-containing protein, partial [Defluviitaleaceae bacterium]|nr:SpoIID/LytB domain-containing protein [Defluviitaleaceae bacterium]
MNKYKFFAALIIIVAVFFVPINAYAEFSHTIRVGLTRSFGNRDSIQVNNASIWAGYGVEEGFLPMVELFSESTFTVRAGGGNVEIVYGGRVLYTFTAGRPAQIMASDSDIILLGGERYRGSIEFVPSGGRITAVNVLSLEEYLFGVLPAEMSHSFHLEALKAQAVASRSFSFHQILQSKHVDQNFDICDTTCCQVYRGAYSEHENTTMAVLQTYGLMLFHDGEIISANYFSSSGGATENSEDVWWEARAYLRSVNEIVEHNPMVWERTFTWTQLTNAASNAGARIGAVTGVSISQLGASGRVLELTLHGANGSWAIPRSVGVRSFFNAIGGTLPSRNFQIAGAAHSTPQVGVTNGVQNINSPLNSFQALDANGAISTVHFGYVYDGQATRHIESTPNIARGGNGITISGRGWG